MTLVTRRLNWWAQALRVWAVLSPVLCAVLGLLLLCPAPLSAQEDARVMPEDSQMRDDWRGRTHVTLALSAAVPWRVFPVAGPDRIVLDVQGLDLSGLDLARFDASDAITQVSAGPLRAGWSRMVFHLAEPMAVQVAALATSETPARLSLRLAKTSREAFDAAARVAPTRDWLIGAQVTQPSTPAPSDRLTIVLDPGHGGIDPGAIRRGYEEADLVLQMALDLEAALLQSDGIDVVLTRRADEFVSLDRRVAIAAQVGADAFISLHADALSEGQAQGAAIYTLSDTATDAASQALAERHNRADLLAGVDLTEADDEVARVLLDLARQVSQPRSEALARDVMRGIAEQDLLLHARPLQQAGFSVLKSAEVPSVLIEVAFLSTDADLERLLDPAWRTRMAEGIQAGLLSWLSMDRAMAPLRLR